MAQAGAVSDKELFLDILEDLGDEEFEKFKWFLEGDGIKKSELEKANRMETVVQIIQTFSRRSAEVIKEVLQKIRRNDLVERLPNSTERPGTTLTDRDEGTRVSSLKESLRTWSRRLNSASPSVYKVPLKNEVMNIAGCQRFSLGNESMKQNRTIMLLGATRSGKSTLINGMINYIVGVNWEDDFRFTLTKEEYRSQAESQTTEVTVYKINHQEEFRVPFSLTIIDTPGFGDTRGIKRDREITEYLRNLLSSQAGVSEIDAVCVVVQASLARLTPTQKFVFDSVLSIFGKDVTENIRILVTFADSKPPPVLKAINAAHVLCPKTEDEQLVHFKFNNLAVFAENKTSAADNKSDSKAWSFDEMFWDMDTESMKMFFEALELMDTKSLTLTQEVLRESKQLKNLIEKLQELVKAEPDKFKVITETEEKLEQYEFYICLGKEMEQKVDVSVEAKSHVEELFPILKAEYDALQTEVKELMAKSTRCLKRLKEIALKPDPLSTRNYISMFIEAEKFEKNPGWEDRVQSLTDMRERAIIMVKVDRGEKLLPQRFNQQPTSTERLWKNHLRSQITSESV